MKKNYLTLFSFIAFVLAISSTYFFIPGTITVSKIIYVKCTAGAASRLLTDQGEWPKWWPGNNPRQINRREGFIYDSYACSISKRLYNAAEVELKADQKSFGTVISIIPVVSDSAVIHWQAKLLTGLNPFKRITAYWQARRVKKEMTGILDQLRAYLEKDTNIYGYAIVYTTLKDTVLVATKTFVRQYPDTKTIYESVKCLRQYITSQNAEETDYPMLNVTAKNNGYEVMVGIPVNKDLHGTNKIFFRHLVPMENKILATEVTGGPETIKQAFNAIEVYMSDHVLSAPVIPFAYLITDRSKVSDTARWVTKIYYPII